jgi:GDP-4-dehydro-6-deoxy-D-mannose reductase
VLPASPYGVTKVAQDQLAIRAISMTASTQSWRGRSTTPDHVRKPTTRLPSFARQIARIEAGFERPVLRVGNLDTKRDLTDVRDVVAAYVALMAARDPGTPINVCSGRAWRIGDLLDTLRGLAQVTVALEPDPDRLRPNDIPLLQGDATRLRNRDRMVPAIPIERTLRDTLDWWRAIVAARTESAGAEQRLNACLGRRCVEKSPIKPRAENGFMMNMCAVAGLASIGTAAAPASMRRSACASP